MDISKAPSIVDANSTNLADGYKNYEQVYISLIVNCVLNALLCIIAVLGNSVVIYSLWNSALLHSPSNVILFCLAFCDLGVGFVVQPFYIIYQMFYVTKRRETWLLAMKAFNFVANFFSGVSFLTTTAVSVDRYLAIHLHLRYQELLTVRRTVQVLLILWLFTAFVVSSLIWNSSVTFFAALTIIVVCLLTISSTYLKIYLVVRSQRRKMKEQRRSNPTDQPSQTTKKTVQQIKCVTNMFYVCALHIMCFTPYLVFLALRDGYETSVFTYLATEFAQTLVYLNSSLNPAVYCWRLREIRVAVKRTLVMFYCNSEFDEGFPKAAVFFFKR